MIIFKVSGFGSLTETNNSTSIDDSNEELINYLKGYRSDGMNNGLKFSYALMYPLTRNLLNLTYLSKSIALIITHLFLYAKIRLTLLSFTKYSMHIKTTTSWGYKTNEKWDGIIGMLISGEADFSIILNAIRPERITVIDYSATTTWKHWYVM